jgi:hypothetical protein
LLLIIIFTTCICTFARRRSWLRNKEYDDKTLSVFVVDDDRHCYFSVREFDEGRKEDGNK